MIISALVLSCSNDKNTGQNISETAINTPINVPTKKVKTSSPEETLTPQQKLGKRLFIMCAACHNVQEDEPHKVGPNLHGVFGRKAGALTDFKYSEAFMESDIIWTDETIRAWLIDPNGYINGTNMVFVGLPKKHQQDALLAYLHHVADATP